MTELAISSMFTGAVIFVWGFRVIRNRRVNVLYVKMRSQVATWIFGIVSSLCGILMALTGWVAATDMAADRGRGELARHDDVTNQ